MKLNKYLNSLLFTCFLVLFTLKGFSQTLTVANYTACPCQVVTVTPVWFNVAITSQTLNAPTGIGPNPAGLVPLGSGPFTISHCSTTAASYQYTLYADGVGNSGAVTNSVVFLLTIVPPPPVSFANPQHYYCSGATATIDATPGSSSYLVTAPGFNQTYFSNLITMPNQISGGPVAYTVTSIGTCTSTGVFTISVAPNTPLTVNTSSTVCQGSPVQLIANIVGGVNYDWYNSNFGPVSGGSPTFTITSATINHSGPWTATAVLPFPSPAIPGGASCPVIATTTVSVVQTVPVTATASPLGIVCENSKINFNAGAGAGGVQANGWSWAGPNGFSSTIANPIINPAKPINAGVYSVTALFINNIVCTTSAIVNVNVIAVNQPAISMPNAVCQGNNVNYTVNASNASAWFITGPNSYTRSGLSAAPAYSFASRIDTVKANAAGIYYFTGRFGASQYSCNATTSVQLNVVPINSVSVIPPSPVCMPNNGYLQATAIGASQYSWTGPNNFYSPFSNPTVYYPTPTASGIYTVRAFFTGGGITCTNSNTVSLTVSPILTFSLNPRQQACYDTPLSIIGPVGATSYTWTSSTGFTSNTKDIYFPSVQPANSGNYTLNVSLGSCVTSGSTNIDILTRIELPPKLQPNSRTVCSGDTTYAEVFVVGGSQNYAFDWNPSIFFTDDQRGPRKTIIPLGSQNYNITVYDIACPNFTQITSFSVTVNMPPKPNLELMKTRGCDPLTQIYDPQTKNEAFVTTFNFGGLKQFQITDTSGKSDPYTLNTGTYNLVVYSKGKKELGGCSGVYEYPYPIIVDPLPGAEITWSPEMPTTTDLITFYPSNINGPIVKRLWNFSGGEPSVIDTSIKVTFGSDTSNLLNPVRKYNNIGKYPVVITMQTEIGCEETILRSLVITDDFKVYIPNSFTPNGDGLNDMFLVKGSGIKDEGFTMELTDRWGNVIFTSKDIKTGWDGRVNGLNAELGTYIYRIRAVGMNGEGRREFVGHFSVMK